MPRHNGCESAGIDSKPRVFGGASVSDASKDAACVLEIDLRGDAHLAEVGGVADRLEFLFARRVEGIPAAFVIGHGVGQHGPRFSLSRSGIHSSCLRLTGASTCCRYCPGASVIAVPPSDWNASRVNAKPKGLPSRSAA